MKKIPVPLYPNQVRFLIDLLKQQQDMTARAILSTLEYQQLQHALREGRREERLLHE